MANYPAEDGAMPALVPTSIGRGGYNLVPGHPPGRQQDLDVRLCSRKCLQRKENQNSSKIEREKTSAMPQGHCAGLAFKK